MRNNMFASLSIVVFEVLVILFFCIANWKIYVKAGKPGWSSLIPIYNLYVLLQIVGKPGWWLILYLIPIVNIIIHIIVSLDLAKSFGRSSAFGIFMLWLFSIVGFPILAFGNSKYIGPGGQSNSTQSTPTTPTQSQTQQVISTPVPPSTTNNTIQN